MTITITWAACAVILAILGHLIFTVWHASRLNTSVTNFGDAIKNLNEELKKRDESMKAMWIKIDNHYERLVKVEARINS